MSTLRRGTTAFVVGGPAAGTIGLVTGGGAGTTYVDRAHGASHQLVVAADADVMKAPHPLAWYQRVQDRHGPCEGCDEVEAAKVAAWRRVGDDVDAQLRELEARRAAGYHDFEDDGEGRCAARPLGGGRYPVCGQWAENAVHTEGPGRS